MLYTRLTRVRLKIGGDEGEGESGKEIYVVRRCGDLKAKQTKGMRLSQAAIKIHPC